MTTMGILMDVGKSMSSFGTDLVSIEFDVTVDEAHDWANDITSSPVEVGANITDHIIELPKKLKLQGFVSNYSIDEDNPNNQQGEGDGGLVVNKIEKVFELLQGMMDKRELVTVYTRYVVYTDMAIVSINIPRNLPYDGAIEFNIEFIKVKLVSTQTVDVPDGISRKLDKKAGTSVQNKTQPKKEKGSVQPVDETSKSGAKSIKEAFSKISEMLKGSK